MPVVPKPTKDTENAATQEPAATQLDQDESRERSPRPTQATRRPPLMLLLLLLPRAKVKALHATLLTLSLAIGRELIMEGAETASFALAPAPKHGTMENPSVQGRLSSKGPFCAHGRSNTRKLMNRASVSCGRTSRPLRLSRKWLLLRALGCVGPSFRPLAKSSVLLSSFGTTRAQNGLVSSWQASFHQVSRAVLRRRSHSS